MKSLNRTGRHITTIIAATSIAAALIATSPNAAAQGYQGHGGIDNTHRVPSDAEILRDSQERSRQRREAVEEARRAEIQRQQEEQKAERDLEHQKMMERLAEQKREQEERQEARAEKAREEERLRQELRTKSIKEQEELRKLQQTDRTPTSAATDEEDDSSDE